MSLKIESGDQRAYFKAMTTLTADGIPPFQIVPDLIAYVTGLPVMKIPRHATLIFARDRSGSMGTWEVIHCNHMYNWLIHIFNEVYAKTRTFYVTYGTEGEEVDAGDFASASTSGGTIVSTGVKVVQDIINETDSDSDIYVFLMSDGDNLTSDNHRVMNMLKNDILNKVKFFGYFEVNQYSRSSTVMDSIQHLEHANFRQFALRDSDEFLWAIEVFVQPMFMPGGNNEENEQRLQSFNDWAFQ